MTRPVQQCIDRSPKVHSLTTPTRHCRAWCDSDSAFGKLSDHLCPVASHGILTGWAALSGLTRRDRRSIRTPVPDGETKRAVIEHLNVDAALVHLTMVEAAQENEIGKASLAAVGPVLDVMPIDEVLVCTAWKAATVLVACVQGAAD